MTALPWGLLWYDSDPQRAPEEKVLDAALRYREKFGDEPDVCFVSLKENAPESVDGIEIICNKSVLAHHWWIGIGS